MTDLAAWCSIKFDNIWGTNPLCYARNLYMNGQLITQLEIPDNVTTIGAYTFHNLKVSSIILPSSITSIEEGAFCYCSVSNVFYKGTESQWKQVKIGSENFTATDDVLFYSKTNKSGCWRYVGGLLGD